MGNSNATGRKDDPVPPHLWHTVMDSAGHRGGPGKAGVKDSSLAPGPTPDDGGLARLHRWVDDRLFERRRRDRIEAEEHAIRMANQQLTLIRRTMGLTRRDLTRSRSPHRSNAPSP